MAQELTARYLNLLDQYTMAALQGLLASGKFPARLLNEDDVALTAKAAVIYAKAAIDEAERALTPHDR